MVEYECDNCGRRSTVRAAFKKTDDNQLICHDVVRCNHMRDYGKPIMIDICKDGTISYRQRGERSFNGKALPVFSVNTVEQAKDIQVRFGKVQYKEHPLLPNQPWYRWSGFDGNVETLEEITRQIRSFFQQQEARLP